MQNLLREECQEEIKQKAIIAREVESNSDLLIAVQPTRGLDVGAIVIYS